MAATAATSRAAVSARVLMGGKGGAYVLGQRLRGGSGGEGTVYAIEGDDHRVAKIFHDNTFSNGRHDREYMRRKLCSMLAFPVSPYSGGRLLVAWPEDILYNGGKMVGYVMPRASARYKFHDVCRNSRVKIFPNFTWGDAVKIAYNLAEIVAAVHQAGIVIGDMNTNNIMIGDDGSVTLIDTDSFDIRDRNSGEHFRCEVGVSEILAPELQTASNLANTKICFTKESDNFSLAIHLFMLLMNDCHPFNCPSISGAVASTSQISQQDEICNGNCAYVRGGTGRKVNPNAPEFSMLPPDIQRLFVRTFHYTALTAIKNIPNRATAEEWSEALRRLNASGLIVCPVNAGHLYPAHNSFCPWCHMQSTSLYISPKTADSSGLKAPKRSPGKPGSTARISAGPARRSPVPFYIAMSVMGLVSGPVFGKYLYNYLENMAASIAILATIGLVIGLLAAHHYERKYIQSDNACPWLLLGAVPFLGAPLAVCIVGIIIAIVIGILYIIACILIVAFVIALFSGG